MREVLDCNNKIKEVIVLFKITKSGITSVFFRKSDKKTEDKEDKFVVSNLFLDGRYDRIIIPNTVRYVWTDISYEEPNANLNHITEISIGTSVEDLSGCVFMTAGIKEVIIPTSVKKIGQWAFASCPNLETVIFNGTPEIIGRGAFINCPKLKNIKIPEGSLCEGIII